MRPRDISTPRQRSVWWNTFSWRSGRDDRLKGCSRSFCSGSVLLPLRFLQGLDVSFKSASIFAFRVKFSLKFLYQAFEPRDLHLELGNILNRRLARWHGGLGRWRRHW